MIRENPIRPFTVVIGGEIKDKIGALEHLLPKADKVIVGGAGIYFLKGKRSQNRKLDYRSGAHKWVEKALSTYGDKILLPSDHLWQLHPNDTSVTMVCGDILYSRMSGFDIGNETVERYSAEVGLKWWCSLLEWPHGYV